MAKFGKVLNDKAAELIATVSSDLASDLDLADPKVQQRIVVALDGARKRLERGPIEPFDLEVGRENRHGPSGSETGSCSRWGRGR